MDARETTAHSGTASTSSARERRDAAWRSGLAGLLERRPELRGVYRPADFAEESVRWSV